MCGLVGFIDLKSDVEANWGGHVLKKMCDRIRHRGPDGEGQTIIGPVGLGHRRLAIIDLNERSLQPMYSSDQRLCVAFNGEIYNFQELRKQLQELGCRFKTLSDTEVLLHGWRVWGQDLPQRLRGMFAFALWDSNHETLFIARDRFGKKPLYYYRDDDKLIFGSEIKSIIQWPDLPREVNNEAVHDYLNYGYCVGQHTAFKGIYRLMPAHCMVVEKGKVKAPRRYWTLASIDPAKSKMTRREARRELVERFDESLRLRLVADVPVGAFLSGGVDSSAVVARSAPQLPHRLKTFSVGFPIEGFDETAYAREVAKRYNTEHHSFIMDYDLIEELPKLIWYYGEPYSDSSAIVTYALSREVRRHVTVAVSGDGGDEVLLGYSRYFRFQDLVEEKRTKGTMSRTFPVGPFETEPSMRDVYTRMISKFRDEHQMMGYGENLLPFIFTPAADRLGLGLENAESSDALDRVARVDCNVYLPDDLLIKADIATMANSLEGRSPFLDHEFADWCASLPQDLRVYKRKGSVQSKALLKHAMEPYLPHGCMYRRKMGFSVPVKHWMKTDLKAFMIETLTSKRFRDRGFVLPEFIDLMLERHMSDYEDHGTRLWGLLCLEIWCQTFIDADGARPLNLNVVDRRHTELEVVE